MKRLTIISLSIFLFTAIINGADLNLRHTYLFKAYTDTTDFWKHYKELDKFYSDKKLGSFVEDDSTIFRLFAPSATLTKLCI